MAANQESVSRILSILSHPLRRQILITLNEKGECSFTDLMNSLNIDTGKLSFHMRNLIDLLDQKPSGKYVLNKLGENAVRLIMDLEAWTAEINIGKAKSSISTASFTKRALAFLIDSAVVAGVFAAAAVLNTIFSAISGGSFRLDVNVILFFIVFWVYSTLLEGFGGQSLGKRLTGLAVIRVDGKKMFYDHAAVRNFGKIFIILPFDLLAGRRIKDKRFIRYFDMFAGTTVIDLHPDSLTLAHAQS